MAPKRDFSDFQGPTDNGDQAGRSFNPHGSERTFSREDQPFKKQKSKKHSAKEGSFNWTKKRIRTIERRLARDTSNIPADVQRDLERELASLQKRANEDKNKKHRSKMIQKYHMVRFFERQKAKRLEKQLKTKLGAAKDPAEIERLKADLHIAAVDVMYTQHFPHLERYISLYSSPASSGEGKQSNPESKRDKQATAEAALHTERPPLWTDIEKAMEKGQHALDQLRERRLNADSQPNETPPDASKHGAKTKSKKIQTEKGKSGDAKQSRNPPVGKEAKQYAKKKAYDEEENDDDESDSDGGGFFEED